MRMVWLVLVVVLWCSPAFAHQYYNADSESCNSTSHPAGWVLCDDFEDGDFVVSNGDRPIGSPGDQNPANDGWDSYIFFDWDGLQGPAPGACGAACPNGTGFSPPQVTGYARCGSLGANGSNCTATTGVIKVNGTDGSSMYALHNGEGLSTNTHLFGRWYFKNSAAFTCGHQKFLALGNDPDPTSVMVLVYLRSGCTLKTIAFREQSANDDGPGGDETGWWEQNVSSFGAVPNDHWIFVEVEAQLNTNGGGANGVFRLWVDDCGTSGTACTGTPTLRSQYTNAIIKCYGAGNPAPCGGSGTSGFFLNAGGWNTFSNPAATGEQFLDNIVVSTTGPIGFAGAGADTTPPAAPTGVTISKPVAPQNLHFTAGGHP